ncbi:hypothetical protein [Natronorarus salvus]|uniref:hypothetical protein n=1 Tax=Natronorarus salvus TaxID=3117733 RepID=UPI002F260786
MFEWLFPTWSDPTRLAAVVGLRVGLNVCLVVIAASAAGARTRLSVLAGCLTLASAVITVLALRPGGLGLPASYVELLVQMSLLVLVGYAVSTNPSTAESVAYVVVSLGAVALGLLMVPIYGETFVAP